ncbi:MAG: hypothetical protein IIZ13_09780 [Renibacterium sp.]|nr:hypothetical protein [Renibacterium sp.]
MALTRGIFIRKDGKSVTDPAGTDPRSARKAMSGLVAGNADGVPRSGIFPQKDVLIVIGSQAGMVYRVKPFEGALIRDAAGSDGVVLYANDALTDVPTSPAPSTGSRWDLVYVQYPESTSDSTSSKPVLGVVQGTASGTPSKPSAALPANSYLLAESLVSAGNSTTVDTSINQVWRYTVPRGVPIPVRNQAERDELASVYPGQQVKRLDLGSDATETWDGLKWKLSGVRRYAEFFNNGFDVAANQSWDGGPLTLDAAKSENPDFIVTGQLSGSVRFTADGVYNCWALTSPLSNPGEGIWFLSLDGRNIAVDGSSTARWEVNPMAISLRIQKDQVLRFTLKTTNAHRLRCRLGIERTS